MKLFRQLPVGAAVAFLSAFAAIPLFQSGFLTAVPGDLGDGRLNNYILEHVYLFLKGDAESLWHPGFFHPFPYVLGFSDNLLGASPPYLLARTLALDPIRAFQAWFLFSYAANFTAAYYVFRRLDCSEQAATVGALVFAFALPVSGHTFHAQLHYRFGLPLAVGYLLLFLKCGDWRLLSISQGWLTWQFYAGIYSGFFSALMIAAILAVHLFFSGTATTAAAKQYKLAAIWYQIGRAERWRMFAHALFWLSLLVFLFLPYLQVSRLYGFERRWFEVASMLPRPQSYLIADHSVLWGWAGKLFKVPMRHEHQMLFGLVPITLALLGYRVSRSGSPSVATRLMPAAFAVLVAATLSVGGFSFWLLIAKLPLVSAIRAMSRIDLALLLPVAYLSALAIDGLPDCSRRLTRQVSWVVIVLFIIESAATRPHWLPIESWRQRLAEAEARPPDRLPDDAVLFFSQAGGPAYADELDAMWAAIRLGHKTLNGYSGWTPPGYAEEFSDPCEELRARLAAYRAFANLSEAASTVLAKRVVPVGFGPCPPFPVRPAP